MRPVPENAIVSDMGEKLEYCNRKRRKLCATAAVLFSLCVGLCVACGNVGERPGLSLCDSGQVSYDRQTKTITFAKKITASKKASSVTLSAMNAVYSGKSVVIGAAKVNGSTGAVSEAVKLTIKKAARVRAGCIFLTRL